MQRKEKKKAGPHPNLATTTVISSPLPAFLAASATSRDTSRGFFCLPNASVTCRTKQKKTIQGGAPDEKRVTLETPFLMRCLAASPTLPSTGTAQERPPSYRARRRGYCSIAEFNFLTRIRKCYYTNEYTNEFKNRQFSGPVKPVHGFNCGIQDSFAVFVGYPVNRKNRRCETCYFRLSLNRS